MIRGGPIARLGLGAILAGCGVAGHPVPPGPLPPAAPADVRILSTPDGLEVHMTPPTRDIDGGALTAPPELLVFVDDPRCAGLPAGAAAASPLTLALKPDAPITLRVAAAIGGRRGPPAPPLTARWAPPPPPPAAPIGFSTPDGGIQIAWLPPEPPVAEILVLRDGAIVGRAPAAQARFVDRPPPGAHRYALVAATAIARSAPSPATPVTAP